MERFRTWGYAVIAAVVLLGLCAALAYATGKTWVSISKQGTALHWVIFLAHLALFAALAWLERKRPPDERTFLIAVLAVGFAARLTYGLFIDLKLNNDFGEMWRAAQEIAGGHASTAGGHPSKLGFLFRERALPFHVPLAWLFGGANSVFEVANACAVAASCAVIYLLTRRWFGIPAARFALVVATLAPETYFASAISTHDIPGALYLLLSLMVLDQVWIAVESGAHGSAVAWALLLGVTAWITDLQRGYAPFWVAAVAGAVVLAAPRMGWRRSVALAACAVVIPAVLGGVLRTATRHYPIMGTHAERQQFIDHWLAAWAPSYSDGSYEGYASDVRYPYIDVDARQTSELRRDILRSDLVLNEQRERVPNHFRRSGSLLQLGSQDYFYFHPSLGTPGSKLTQPEAARALTAWNLAFVALFQPLLLVALAYLALAFAAPARCWPALLFLTAILVVQAQMGNSQPRYAYPIWFIGAAIIGGFLARFTRRRQPVAWREGVLHTAVAAVAVGVAVFMAFTLGRAALAGSDRVYVDLSVWTPADAPRPADGRLRRRLVFRENSAAGTRVAIKHSYPSAGPRMLRAWVRSAMVPGWPPQCSARDGIEASILINGIEAARFTPQAHARLVELPAQPKDGRVDIELALTANRATASADCRTVVLEYVRLLDSRGAL